MSTRHPERAKDKTQKGSINAKSEGVSRQTLIKNRALIRENYL